MLPQSHVLDLIKNATPKSVVDVKRKFVDKHEGKWAIIRQEHLHNGAQTLNHIESVHEFSDIPYHKMTKHHTIYPVTNDMVINGSFRGHDKHI